MAGGTVKPAILSLNLRGVIEVLVALGKMVYVPREFLPVLQSQFLFRPAAKLAAFVPLYHYPPRFLELFGVQMLLIGKIFFGVLLPPARSLGITPRCLFIAVFQLFR